MINEKVSVVVPIFKVEEYLVRCIDSILKQTYTNLEVILVNDGSPDHCGKIIESYKEKDSRVITVHKKNGGLSDARNEGMKYVTGNLTMFVDSDDWLNETMIETMVQKREEIDADIVQSAFFYAYDDKLLFDNRYTKKSQNFELLDNNTLMYELVKNEKVKNFAWGKLYKTKLIKEIPFKKGVLFEDVFWAHQVMHHVNRYVILYEPFYYYYQRYDSIVATYTPNHLDLIKGMKERHEFIQKHYHRLSNNSYQQILETCLVQYHLLLINGKNQQMNRYKKGIEKYIRDNFKKFKLATKNNRRLKVKLYLFRLHPSLNTLIRYILQGLRKIKILSKPESLKRVNV